MLDHAQLSSIHQGPSSTMLLPPAAENSPKHGGLCLTALRHTSVCENPIHPRHPKTNSTAALFRTHSPRAWRPPSYSTAEETEPELRQCPVQGPHSPFTQASDDPHRPSSNKQPRQERRKRSQCQRNRGPLRLSDTPMQAFMETPFFMTVLDCSEDIRAVPSIIWPSSSAGGRLACPVPSRSHQREPTSLAWSSMQMRPAPSLTALPGYPPKEVPGA